MAGWKEKSRQTTWNSCTIGMTTESRLHKNWKHPKFLTLNFSPHIFGFPGRRRFGSCNKNCFRVAPGYQGNRCDGDGSGNYDTTWHKTVDIRFVEIIRCSGRCWSCLLNCAEVGTCRFSASTDWRTWLPGWCWRQSPTLTVGAVGTTPANIQFMTSFVDLCLYYKLCIWLFIQSLSWNAQSLPSSSSSSSKTD